MESVIRRRLTGNEELCALLAKQMTSMGIEPAIYYSKAPADVDLQEGNYPQIVFGVDKFTDAIHGVAGLLTVDIICSQDTTEPETIERLVRESLEGVFFAPPDDEIFLLKWSKSEVFNEPASERIPMIIGATLTFEMYAFPNQITSTPDPILALQEWTANLDVIVIGHSDFGESFIPSRDKPAFYFSMQEERFIEQTHTTIWLDGLIRCHVFAPDVHSRREWLTLFRQEILFCTHVFLADGSPMRLQDCRLNFNDNEIQGQLQLTFRYGLWRQEKYAHPMIGKGVRFDKNLRWRNGNYGRGDFHDKGACTSGS